jgi:putative transposase
MTLSPTREWWTAEQIAEAKLPDLPETKRGVALLAKRQDWQRQASKVRRRQGKGGGWEYHWTLFPSLAQQKLIVHAAPAAIARDTRPAKTAAASSPERDEVWAWFDGLPTSVKDKARKRLATIQKVEALVAGGSTWYLAAIDAARMDGVSERSIWNWIDMTRAVRADDRLAYLAPRHRATKRASRRSVIDPRFGDLIRADYLRLERPSLTSVYDRAVRIAQAEGLATVPIQTVRRWLDRTVSKTMLVLARQGYEALMRLYPSQERDKTSLHALEAVNADFHRFDVFVRFPAGPGGQKEEIIRAQLVAFQDIYSGKILSWRLDRSPNSHAVQLAIGDMIERWGIPDHVLVDNGREFAAKLITGGVPTRFRFKVKVEDISGLLTTLGCKIHWATPYHGQAKPIERAWRDLCDRVAKHPAFAGAYTGNNPGAKPENYGDRAIPLEDFVSVLSEEIALHNARADRRSEIAFGRSFDDVFAESYGTATIRKATAAQRRLWLLGAEGIRTHGTSGQVQFMGNRYWADWMTEIAGERVVARFDRAALWDGLHIYSMDDEYLGLAPCLVKAGFFSIDDARSHARARKDWRKAQKAELTAYKRLTADDVATALAALPSVADPDMPEAAVIRPVFDAAKPRGPAPMREDEIAMQAEIIGGFTERRINRASESERDAGKATFIRARDLERSAAAGAALTPDQQRWLAGYKNSPEYLSWAGMVEEFGESCLAG